MIPHRVAPTLLASLLTVAPLAAQLPEFGETIEVRVVNVDAVVTSADGIPVRGLGVEDFELLVDGVPVPIDYFSAIEDGTNLSLAAGATSASPAEEPSKPYLAIVWDQRSFGVKDSRQVLERLVEELPRLVDASAGILVARKGRGLQIEQNFTLDPDALRAAFERLGESALMASTRGERSLLIGRLERAASPSDALGPEEALQVEFQAEQMLDEINILARQEQTESITGLQQLRQLVAMIANLPGRKSVLYLGQGVQTRPAEAIYRMWWAKYSSIAAQLGAPRLQSQIDPSETVSHFRRLLNAANSQRVAFYVHDAGGLQTVESGFELRTLGAASASATESLQLQQALLQLARSTGGLGTLNKASFEPLVDGMLRDFRSYYSLGFEAGEALPSNGRIEVRMRRPDLEVRHFDRYDSEVLGADVERAAMATLITEHAENPLGASVEVGDFERRKNGNWVVPLLVKVPISELALLPDGSRHVGRLSVVIVAQSSNGDLSRPALGEVPIEIDNQDLLGSLGRLVGYRVRMEIASGRQTISIGMRDDVARTLSTLRLSLSPGADSG